MPDNHKKQKTPVQPWAAQAFLFCKSRPGRICFCLACAYRKEGKSNRQCPPIKAEGDSLRERCLYGGIQGAAEEPVVVGQNLLPVSFRRIPELAYKLPDAQLQTTAGYRGKIHVALAEGNLPEHARDGFLFKWAAAKCPRPRAISWQTSYWYSTAALVRFPISG